jgi:hypothetical protein
MVSEILVLWDYYVSSDLQIKIIGSLLGFKQLY